MLIRSKSESVQCPEGNLVFEFQLRVCSCGFCPHVVLQRGLRLEPSCTLVPSLNPLQLIESYSNLFAFCFEMISKRVETMGRSRLPPATLQNYEGAMRKITIIVCLKEDLPFLFEKV